jgi:hypothetical protein
MKESSNDLYITLFVIANTIALLQLLLSIKRPGLARLSFFLLFAWASWTNWKTALQMPLVYLEYGDLTWSSWYRDFINGWFASHIRHAVGTIASCQALIALSMLLKGWIFRTGCVGAILFLLAIIPFGMGSGFPTTLIMAIAVALLLKKHNNSYIWEKRPEPFLTEQEKKNTGR